MKKFWIFLILILTFFSYAYSEIIFEDDFDNKSKVSYYSNIIFTNSLVKLSNDSSISKGIIVSKKFSKTTNQKWNYIKVEYRTIDNEPIVKTKITIQILNTNQNILYSVDLPQSKNIEIIDISTLNFEEKTLMLKAILDTGIFGPPFTPLELSYWEMVTIGEEIQTNIPIHPETFIGAPAPLKIDNASSKIRFYYTLKKDCSVTLKIYDTNYNLIKTILNNERYEGNTNLDAFWDGKNGNGIYVMSGAYIAIMTIKNDDGSEENIDPFVFAIIR